MPRTARLILHQSYYHVMTRGNNRNIVFKTDDDYWRYLEIFTRYKEELPFDLYHYCLMPNHVHLLIKTNKSNDFSLFMKKLNLSYFHYFRKKYSWVGHFWQDRFKSQPIGKDEYFIQCGKYIELNPVRAKLTLTPEEYLYSSYKHYAKGEFNNLISNDFVFESMGKTIEERQRNYNNLLISSIIVKNYKKPIWGSKYQRYNELKKIRYHLYQKQFAFD